MDCLCDLHHCYWIVELQLSRYFTCLRSGLRDKITCNVDFGQPLFNYINNIFGMLKYENITCWTDVALYKLIALQTTVKMFSTKSKITLRPCQRCVLKKGWIITLWIFLFMQQIIKKLYKKWKCDKLIYHYVICHFEADLI